MATRIEFSMKVKRLVWERARGVCECGCGRPFGKHPMERPEYDHVVEAALGGDGSPENCLCLRRDCHRAKTSARAPALAKAARGEKERANLRPVRKRKLPGAKDGNWKAKVGGGWERRE